METINLFVGAVLIYAPIISASILLAVMFTFAGIVTGRTERGNPLAPALGMIVGTIGMTHPSLVTIWAPWWSATIEPILKNLS